MLREVDHEGEATRGLDELSAQVIAKAGLEGEWKDSPSVTPASQLELFESSRELKTKKRLVRKSIVEGSPELDDQGEIDQSRKVKPRNRLVRKNLELDDQGEDQNRPSKRKAEDLEKRQGTERARKVGDGLDDRKRDGRLGGNKKGTAGQKLANFGRNGGEANDADEVNKLFKSRKKKNSIEQAAEDIALFVEQFLTKLDDAAEADEHLNQVSKPAMEKMKMLPKLWNLLKKEGQLQHEFLDRGILSSLKRWFKPLPDGSLPNRTFRFELFKILTDLHIDVEDLERREQLQKSGLEKVVIFFSRVPGESPESRKLARDLVDKWSLSLFPKKTPHFIRKFEDERPPSHQMPVQDPIPKRCVKVLEKKKSKTSRRQRLEEVLRSNKSKKKSLQAARLSVEGRGLMTSF